MSPLKLLHACCTVGNVKWTFPFLLEGNRFWLCGRWVLKSSLALQNHLTDIAFLTALLFLDLVPTLPTIQVSQ